jgi:preprotein translocase subunit SecD
MQTLKSILALLALALATGCATNRQTTIRFHEQVSSSLPESRVLPVAFPKAELALSVDPSPALSEHDIQRAEPHQTAGGTAVLLQFDAHGQFKLDELTTRCRGRHLVVFVNDRPATAWLVDRRLTNGQFLLEGDFSDEDAAQIIESLNRAAAKGR